MERASKIKPNTPPHLPSQVFSNVTKWVYTLLFIETPMKKTTPRNPNPDHDSALDLRSDEEEAPANQTPANETMGDEANTPVERAAR